MTKDKQSYIHVGTKGVIRRCKSKEDRQCNGLKKNDHRQTIIHTCPTCMYDCLSIVIFL
jgi:hypothetical protein